MDSQCDPEDGEQRIVPVRSQEAREKLARMLQALEGGTLVESSACQEFEQYYRRNPEQVIALHEELLTDATNPMEALMASSMVFAASKAMPGGIRNLGASAKAQAQITLSLMSSVIEERRLGAFSCAYLHAPPSEAARSLVSMSRSEDEMERVFAASACSWYFLQPDGGENVPCTPSHIHSILLSALSSGDPLCVAMATRGIGRIGEKHEKDSACDAVLARLDSELSAESIYHLVEALEAVGSGNNTVAAALSESVANVSIPLTIRCMAARTLVRTAVPENVHNVLSLFLVQDPRIAEFAILSLKESQVVSDSVVQALASEWLVSEKQEVREAACRVIGVLPNGPHLAKDQLMTRVGTEVNCDIIEALAIALSRVGDEIIPFMVSQVKTRNVAAMSVAAEVLRRSGSSGALAVMHEITQSSDPWLRSVLVAILANKTDGNEQIIRELAQFLKGAPEDPGVFIIQAIMGAGQVARAALPELMGVFLDGHGVMVEWAERAILAIGPDATAALDVALTDATDNKKARLERVRHWVEPIRRTVRSRMRRLSDSELLIFVFAGSLLLEGPKSLAELSKALVSIRKAKRHNVGFPCSEPSISRAFAAITRWLGGGQHVVLSHGKKPMTLTKLGQGLLVDAQKYCAQIGMI